MNSDLDIERREDLLAYLRAERHLLPDETPEVHVLRGGVSNRTVLVIRSNGERWVLKQALAKLRVTVEWLSSPMRIHREAEGMRWLEQLAPEGATTPIVFEDHTHHLLAMQAVPEPHENWKTMLLRGHLDLDHVDQFGRLLGTIHRRAADRGDEVARAFDDRSFFDSLRLEPYYRYTAERVSASRHFYESLLQDTWSNRVTLVHGDYSPKNILVYQGRLILLDHEVVHFGDPAFDHGFGFTHLLSKAHHLPDHRDRFAAAALLFWRSYCDSAGSVGRLEGLEERAVRHTLGCLLARVAGRSPLEYMGDEKRARQQAVVLEIMRESPKTIEVLVDQFIARL